jgi:uncharacterized protein DUF4145
MVIDCPNCNARVDAEVVASVDVVGDPDVAEPKRRVSLLRCLLCGNPLVAEDRLFQSESLGDYWEMAERLWPPTLNLSPFIPHDIHQALNEADLCRRAGAFTASVAMTGRALEAVCRHFRTKSKALSGGLKELLARNVIDKRIYEWGEELRLSRNLAAHATEQIFWRLEADALLDFAVAICEYVFVLDEKFKRFKNAPKTTDIMKQLKESLMAKSKSPASNTAGEQDTADAEEPKAN